jgi:hypothetical protein
VKVRIDSFRPSAADGGFAQRIVPQALALVNRHLKKIGASSPGSGPTTLDRLELNLPFRVESLAGWSDAAATAFVANKLLRALEPYLAERPKPVTQEEATSPLADDDDDAGTPRAQTLDKSIRSAIRQDPTLRSLDIGRATRATRSSAGATSGVYFCDVNGQTAVVKPPGRGNDTAPEFVTTVLARQLGIEAPSVALVPMNFEQVKDLAQNDSTQKFFDDVCAADAVLVMEKVKGTSLQDLPPDEAQELFLGRQANSVLKQIGRIAVFDALIGNNDRLPLLGDGGSNPGNIMFSRDGKVIAIDNVGTFKPQLDLLDQIIHHAEQSQIPSHIRMFLMAFTSGIDVGDSGEQAIREGMREMCHEIAQFAHEKIDEILALCEYKKNLPEGRSLERFKDALAEFQKAT